MNVYVFGIEIYTLWFSRSLQSSCGDQIAYMNVWQCQKHCRLHKGAVKCYLVTEEGEITSSVGSPSLGQTSWKRKHMAGP